MKTTDPADAARVELAYCRRYDWKMIEVKSTLVSSENISAYNGWTEFDRSCQIEFDKGPIVEIGCYSTAVFQWRPLIGRRLSPGWKEPKDWLPVYRHPSLVTHTGTGWRWIELMTPIAPWEGLMFPGLYITSAPSLTIQMAMGRAEIGADCAYGVTVTLAENNYQTPAMGIRYAGV